MILHGKVAVILVNDPDYAMETQDGPFKGRRMTYYGRWTYKYDQGMKHKAAGVLIVHETEPAGYPFTVVQGRASEQFDLVTPDKNMSRSDIEGWITLDQAKAMSGKRAAPAVLSSTSRPGVRSRLNAFHDAWREMAARS